MDSLCPFLMRKSFPLTSGKWLSSFFNVGGYSKNCMKWQLNESIEIVNFLQLSNRFIVWETPTKRAKT